MQTRRYFVQKLGVIFLITIFQCVPPESPSIRESEAIQLAPAPTGHKRTLAVLDFVNASGTGTEKIGSAVSDKLVTQLARSHQFVLFERQKIETVLQEQALGQSGTLDEITAPQVGKLAGVQALVLGSILEFNQQEESGKIGEEKDKWEFALKAMFARVSIEYKIVDTVTGEVIFSDVATRQEIKPGFGFKTKEYDFNNLAEIDQTLLGKAMSRCVTEIARQVTARARQITWFGKVIRVTPPWVFFTPGQNAAIQISDIFEVQSREQANSEVSELEPPLIQIVDFIGDQISKARIIQGDVIEIGDWILEHPNQPTDATEP
ncbi:CsgG/HfaB family protein [candidate division KSB1 bacterium]|nr:CsgG/HfaB family protein [candidate division KSB1 bacterium]